VSAVSVSTVLNHSAATGTDLVVLIGIAWHMSDTFGEGAFPSIERLARYCNKSERTVMRSIKNLEELGELDVDRHSGRSYGGQRTNRYWVLTSCPMECDKSNYHNSVFEFEPRFKPVDNSDTPAIFDIKG
jgi:biotin operon repressor